jgi:cell division septation protein DedD
VVQLASYRDRQEADKAQTRLTGRGVAAYVTETKLPDQTVWYRVRVGRSLSRAEAEDLAGKSGKGAVVVKAD